MKAAKAPEISNFRSETATVNGTRLHYWIGGNLHGKPVLLWHGFLGTAYSWHKVMPLLADAGYAVLVPDMRGYGDSDKPAGIAGYDARSLAEEFRALVKQLEFGNGQKLLLVAHDMGAHPALLWAADHPDELSGLVYMEVPTMLEEFLSKVIVYTPEAHAATLSRKRNRTSSSNCFGTSRQRSPEHGRPLPDFLQPFAGLPILLRALSLQQVPTSL